MLANPTRNRKRTKTCKKKLKQKFKHVGLFEATEPEQDNHSNQNWLLQFASFQVLDKTRVLRKPSLQEMTRPDRFQSQQYLRRRKNSYVSYNNQSSWRFPKKMRNNKGLRKRTLKQIQDKTIKAKLKNSWMLKTDPKYKGFITHHKKTWSQGIFGPIIRLFQHKKK